MAVGLRCHAPTGDDKTTILFEFKDVEKPCLLEGVLRRLADDGISMSYLQSIPANGSLDEFTFYMDMRGHMFENHVGKALHAIKDDKDVSFLKVLGSYPAFR